MNRAVKEWRESGQYLPKCLRDFHDAKDLFKAVHNMVDVNEHDYVKSVTWTTGQCYVIDIFLWFMARFGYTLQKTRKRLEFEDIYKTVADCREYRNKQFADMINERTP